MNCPLCADPSRCRGYPLMWERLREGRDVGHWTRIHDRLDGAGEYPPLLTQAGNAIGAAGRFVASGLAVVDGAERSRRLAICNGCPHFDAGPGRCTRCGCAARWKVTPAAERCPLGLW